MENIQKKSEINFEILQFLESNGLLEGLKLDETTSDLLYTQIIGTLKESPSIPNEKLIEILISIGYFLELTERKKITIDQPESQNKFISKLFDIFLRDYTVTKHIQNNEKLFLSISYIFQGFKIDKENAPKNLAMNSLFLLIRAT